LGRHGFAHSQARCFCNALRVEAYGIAHDQRLFWLAFRLTLRRHLYASSDVGSRTHSREHVA
jgi:hypothetical protein